MTYNVYFTHPDGTPDSLQLHGRKELDLNLVPDPKYPIKITDILDGHYERFAARFYKDVEQRLGYRLADAVY